ncbi:4-amino-4-deoxy-L-arabinose transferase [Nocardioides panacisoli]|uniref:4-amino-4-deoxy-L-arabinose transferase n=1 Tax=Nocardioides panacisoli TaxID=627624 RepID=A0ABP7IZW7_9ACTN
MATPSELPRDPEQAAVAVVAHAESRPPTLGTGRLVCVDGLAGAGKTTLAAAIGRVCPGTVVLATDEMLEGWGGLPGLGASIEALLRPLAAGRPGRWRRWDWYADRWAEWREVSPAPLLVLEGVGSGASSYADLVTTVVWVEAPAADRRDRWLDREGDARHFASWAADEAALHERERARDRADLVLRT